jgi:hypothetical protein
MVESSVGMNLKTFVRIVVYQARRLLHIHLSRMELLLMIIVA